MTNLSEKVKYWIDLADYDLETASAMLSTNRFLYVGFMCHQVIEKMLKAHFAHVKDDVPPYTHNLKQLSGLLEIFDSFSSEQKDFIEILQPLNIRARYPNHKESLLKLLTKEKCTDIINQTVELKKWIQAKLSK